MLSLKSAAALLAIVATTAATDAIMGRSSANPITEYERASRSEVFVGSHVPPAADWLVCSGVLVDRTRRLAVTALHCLHGGPIEEVICLSPRGAPARQITPPELHDLAAVAHCEVVLKAPDVDLAVVRLSELPSDALAVELSGELPKIGARVHGVTSPHHFSGTWFDGRISNRITGVHYADAPEFSPRETFTLTTVARPGESGGMVLDDRNLLVGMIVAGDKGSLVLPASVISEKLGGLR